MADDDDKGRSPGWWPDEGGTPKGSGAHRAGGGGRRQSGRGSLLDNCLGRIVMAAAIVTAVVWGLRR